MTSPGGAEASRLGVRVLPDTSLFARSLLRYLERIERRTVVRLKTDLDVEHLVRQAREVADAAGKAAKLQLEADVDGKGLVREARKAASTAEKAAKVRLSLDLDPKKIAAGAASLLGLVASGVKLAVVAASMAAVAVQAIHLVAALAPAAGAVAFIPGVALAAAAGIVALKLAFSGLGDALKGDPEALAKLAPAARSVVVELRALAPAWQEVVRAVQGRVFAGVAGDIKGLAQTWLPLLRDKLSGIGGAWNSAFREAAALVKTPQFIRDITTTLDGAASAGSKLAGAVAPLLSIFATLAPFATSFLDSFAGGAAEAASSFASFLSYARDSGDLAAFFQTVSDTLSQIGRIALQVGGILAAVFKATETSGGGLLNNLETILTEVNRFLSAGEGKAALQSIFSSVQAVLKNLLPIIFDLVSALGPGVEALLGEDGLAGGLRALLPAAKPVGQALSAVAKAAAPLLQLLGSLLAVALTQAAGSIQVLMAELGPLIGIVARTGSTLLQTLLPALTQLISGGLPAAIELGTALAEAIAPIVPIASELASTFVREAMPALTQLQTALKGELVPALAAAAQQLGGALIDALRQVAPQLPALTQAAVAFALAFGQILIALVPLIPIIAQLLAQMVSSKGLQVALSVVTFALNTAASSLGTASGGLRTLIGWLTSARDWAQRTGASISGGFSSALSFIGSIPGKVGSMFASAGSWLVQAGRNIIQGLINGISAMIGKLKDKLSSVTNLIPDWKGPAERDRKLLTPSGRLIMDGLMSGIARELPALQAQLAGITTDISSGFTEGIERVQPRQPSPIVGRLASLPGTPTEPGAAVPPPINLTALVRVGDGPVHEAVEAAVADNPDRFAAHLRTGERQLTRRG
ncbi:hypothetical protein [Catellatospora sp. NPDC049609]|uniref:phage tail protein n=1 Tax=Catellatospora sp. NPDC049609 TaxID=3155505 RepID=UPI00342DC467